jgi:hypothetical protein
MSGPNAQGSPRPAVHLSLRDAMRPLQVHVSNFAQIPGGELPPLGPHDQLETRLAAMARALEAGGIGALDSDTISQLFRKLRSADLTRFVAADWAELTQGTDIDKQNLLKRLATVLEVANGFQTIHAAWRAAIDVDTGKKHAAGSQRTAGVPLCIESDGASLQGCGRPEFPPRARRRKREAREDARRAHAGD